MAIVTHFVTPRPRAGRERLLLPTHAFQVCAPGSAVMQEVRNLGRPFLHGARRTSQDVDG
jgi:hypothetical protein